MADEELTKIKEALPVNVDGTEGKWRERCGKSSQINKALLPIKIAMFLWWGASNAVFAYMSIHMKSIGLSVWQIGVIYSFMPLPQIVGQLGMGAIADRFKRHRCFLVCSLIGVAIVATAILHVPPVPKEDVTSIDPDVENKDTWWKCERNVPTENGNSFTACKRHCLPLPKGETGFKLALSCNTVCVNNLHGQITSKQDGNSNPCMEIHRCNCGEECMFELSRGQSAQNICHRSIPSSISDSNELTKNDKSFTSETFYWYFALRIAFEFFSAIIYNLFESIALVLVNQHPGSSFGFQRMWGSVSAGLLPLAAGLMMDNSADVEVTETGETIKVLSNFEALFYMFDALIVLVVVVTFVWIRPVMPTEEEEYGDDEEKLEGNEDDEDKLKGKEDDEDKVESKEDEEDKLEGKEESVAFKTEQRKRTTLQELCLIIKKPEAMVFSLTLVWLGTLWGAARIYVPWRMSELGGDRFLVGLGMTLSTLLGFPIVMFSNYIIKKTGHLPLMVLTFVAYIVRYSGYAFLESPEYFLIFEALEGLTYHLFWVVAVTYACTLAPLRLVATVQGFAGSLHYCVGLGLSGLIAGWSLDDNGAKATFLGFAIAAFIGFILLAVFTWFRTNRKGGYDIKRVDLHKGFRESYKVGEIENDSVKSEDIEKK